MWWLELFLTTSVAICGTMTLISQRKVALKTNPIFKFARSYLPVFLTVLIVRAFIFQPFHVVSGSLEPTVLIGDFLAVNQSAYGVRLPLIHTKIWSTGSPKRGDIALFYYPVDPSLVFVKRVIGVPGDHVIYRNKKLTINGQEMPQTKDGIGFDEEPNMLSRLMSQRIENLAGIHHKIFVDEARFDKEVDVIVPEGKYFMMGDNRDDSEDSRYWGFVDDSLLIGKAYRIIASWDNRSHWFRLSRTGEKFSL